MTQQSPEARKMRRELDKELAAAATKSGRNLVWSAQETAILGLISASFDRKIDLFSAYSQASDPKTMVKLSGELRLLEAHIARLLRQIKTDLPEAPAITPTTLKAQRAAKARWEGRRAN